MLTAFWFTTDKGFGYGVTAASQVEAERLLQSFGYPLPGTKVTGVIINIQHKDLDQSHVVPNAGPIVVHGIWYPRHNV